MTLGCVERRFGAPRAPHPVQSLADNGPAYTAGATVNFAAALNLVACFTPVRSRESSGICGAFVEARATTVLQQLPASLEDHSAVHPHNGLRMLSPREFIEQQSATPAECPV